MSTFDLDAYCARIGHTGPRTPDLDTLRAIVASHVETIPFENLNPLLRWPVRLDEESLQEKIVRKGRGGYCYEHNLLLSRALQDMGFVVTGLGARVVWNQPPGAITARSHMLLRIDLDGRPLIVDVGFGGMTLTGVLRLEVDVEQSTPHEPYRLLRDGDDYVMQALVQREWRSLYRFGLEPQFPIDYEVASWYVSTYPTSHFVTGLVAARAEPGRRYVLRNTELAVHVLNGGTERRVLTTAAELRRALGHEFRLRLPDAPELDAALARIAAGVTGASAVAPSITR